MDPKPRYDPGNVSNPHRLDPIRARSRQHLPPPVERPGYEIFIGLLSILSVVNLIIIYGPFTADGSREIASFMDLPLTVVFMYDFLWHLESSRPRRRYFIDQRGWVDLLGSLPAIFPILRFFRLVRVGRLLRTYRPRDIVRIVRRDRASTALQLVLVLVLVTVEFGGMIVLSFEQDAPGATIRTGNDAIWWAFVSITTVGYGDMVPITPGGRSTAVVMLWSGVALIGVLSAYLASYFLRPSTPDGPLDDVRAPATDVAHASVTAVDLIALTDDLETRLDALRAAIARLPVPDSKGPPADGQGS